MSEQSKDLVLNINEYAYVLDKTKGNIVCWTGPSKTSLSNSDAPVIFNERTKRFEECSMADAVSIQPTAPENWYIIMKNPAPKNAHPEYGRSSGIPESGLELGKKINIPGPVSFPPYPGQMVKVVKGHTLRSNQYLVVRVYEANAAFQNFPRWEEVDFSEETDDDTHTIKRDKKLIEVPYTNGELLVIRGTDKSFYIPPTGFEVVTQNNEYVRDAVTLERLEYCILKDENGKKRYVHGPAVVFPNPTEVFITNEKSDNSSDSSRYKFRAIELTETSGIYVKVIADYQETDEDGFIQHKTGEELFITGKDTMIYYPRPEHSLISYNGSNDIKYYAVAVPKGEGRYVMNKLSGEIRKVTGPTMLLPDPRREVIVQRRLTMSQCKLWYPDNNEVLEANGYVTSESRDSGYLADATLFSTTIYSEKKCKNLGGDSFVRSSSFTEPRTITIDNRFKGVVSIDIWTGYAVNVVSKNGDHRVEIGPKTIMLEYDETLDTVEDLYTSEATVFLQLDNNKTRDTVDVVTEDGFDITVTVSYYFRFNPDQASKWFSVKRYSELLEIALRAKIKSGVRTHTLEDFFQNGESIVREIVLGSDAAGITFAENGLTVFNCEVDNVYIDPTIENALTTNQEKMLMENLNLVTESNTLEVTRLLSEITEQSEKIKHTDELLRLQRNQEISDIKYQQHELELARRSKEETDGIKHRQDIQSMLDDVASHEQKRMADQDTQTYNSKVRLADIEKARMYHYAESIKSIFEAMSPQLIASLNEYSRNLIVSKIAESVSPYAMANGESVATTVDTLLRGTGLSSFVGSITEKLQDISTDKSKTTNDEDQQKQDTGTYYLP